MYLSRIELHGFKSFADRTVLRFSDGLTAIVGPNGSGKTNIIDAIRWVLGEQKTSLLRTDEMSQVIFNGTRTRKPLGMAEVSITIENTKKILPAEFSEVVITRRLFRDGESQYLLNGSQCRRRDIIDLFTDTGMGANAYSVIELKMVEQILEDHSEERRHLFEEAAGIVKYKQRRKETLSKLAVTRNDIERILDHLTELRRSVASLKRQADRAEQYHLINAELRAVELDKHALSYRRYSAQLEKLEQHASSVASKSVDLTNALAQIQLQLEQLNTEISQLDHTRQSLIEQEQQTAALLAELDRNSAILQERIRATKNALDALFDRVQSRTTAYDNLSAEIERSIQMLDSLADEQSRLQQQHTSLRAELDTARSTFEILQHHAEQVAEPLRSLEREHERLLTLRAQLRRSVEHLQQRAHELNKRLDQTVNELHAIEIEQQQLQLHYQQLHHHLQQSEERFVQARARRNELDHLIEQLHQERHRIADELSHLRAEHALLSSIVETSELDISSNRDFPLPLVRTIGDMITVPDQWTIAVESALRGAHRYLVVESRQQLLSLAAWLHAQQHKKVHIVCLELIPPMDAPQPLPEYPRVQWLSSLVECPEPLASLIRALLEGIVAIDTLDRADELFAHVPTIRACVDPHGQLRYRQGILRIGSPLQTEGLSIGRLHRLEKLNKRISHLQVELDTVSASLSDALTERDTIALGALADEVRTAERSMLEAHRALDELNLRRDRLEHLIEETHRELKVIAHEQTALAADDATLDEQLHANEHSQAELLRRKAELDKRLQEQQALIQQLEDRIRETDMAGVRLRARIESLHDTLARLQQQQLALDHDQQGIASEQQQLQEQLVRLETELRACEAERASVQAQLDTITAERHHIDSQLAERRTLSSASQQQAAFLHAQHSQQEKQLHEIQLEAERIRTLRDHLIEQVRNEFGIELASYSSTPLNISAEQIESQIARLKSQLASLGTINFSALEQYRSEQERLEQLEQQYRDLQLSETNLRETIANINTTASELFLRTFEAIRKNFKELFALLFHGDGEADLTMEGDDPLEARINIIARPKGKRPLSIEMLSGGEKTLTAIALLFAIYMVKPSPFCILDEVDAPLDDANIDRYLQLIRRFSTTTQFLLITHNKRTMEAADVLYGVTMQEPGVSKIVSVRLTDPEPVSPLDTE